MRGYFLTKPVAVRAAVGCAVLIPLFSLRWDSAWTFQTLRAVVLVAAFKTIFYLGVVDRDRGQRRRNSANS